MRGAGGEVKKRGAQGVIKSVDRAKSLPPEGGVPATRGTPPLGGSLGPAVARPVARPDLTQTPVNTALAQRHDLYPLEATPSGGGVKMG